MIKAAGIDFMSLPDKKADDLLGAYTGAGTIFGVTGGVMEAALRTVYCLITKEAQPPAIEFSAVRGMDGVKKATIDIKGTQVNIVVAHQMGNVEKVLNEVREDIKNGVKPRYDFIEVWRATVVASASAVSRAWRPTKCAPRVRPVFIPTMKSPPSACRTSTPKCPRFTKTTSVSRAARRPNDFSTPTTTSARCTSTRSKIRSTRTEEKTRRIPPRLFLSEIADRTGQ